MSLFRRTKPPLQPTPSKELRIMRALWELSREKDGGFVSSVDICIRLDEDALSLGLSNVLQGLEDQGLIEHHRFDENGTGDRPTQLRRA